MRFPLAYILLIKSVLGLLRGKLTIPTKLSKRTAMLSEIPLLDQVPSATFEPIMPPVDVLVGFGGLAILLTITTSYWWNVIIPQKRTELAISKSRGELNTLLEALEEPTDSGNTQTKLHRWLLTDWLEQRRKRTPKPAAIPFLKKAKWNSGDNPVLVAFGGIMALVISSALAERVFQ